MIKKLFMILVILVIVLGGGLYAYKELVPPPAEKTEGPVYSTKPVVRGNISVGVEATGTLNPSNSGGLVVPGDYRTAADIQMVIDEYLFKEGDAVKQGEVVVKLASPNLHTKIEQKQRDLEDKIKQLSNLIRTPPEEIENLDPSKGITITSPISGRITNLNVSQGKEVELGQAIAKVVDDSKFMATILAFKAEFDQLEVGQKVILDFPYFNDKCEAYVTDKNPNRIMHKNPGEEFATGFVYAVTLSGDNPGLVQPGMKASLIITDENGNEIRFKNEVNVTGYADESLIMNTSVKAIVTELHVKDLDVVEAGDPIITMSGTDIQELFQQKLNEIRQIRTDLYDLEMKKEQLEIKAPMDGIIASMYKQIGESTTPGEWIGYLYTVTDMRIWTQVDDIDILNVKQGASVRVTVDAVPGEVFSGTVGNVSTMGRDVNGIPKFQVEIIVAGGPELRPGMQAKAFIDAGSAENVLLIPLEAIFEEDMAQMVEVMDASGVPKIVKVDLGLMNDRYAEVKSGLNEGDLVVTGSSADLLPSQHIKDTGGLLPSNGGGDDTPEPSN